jgi:ribulose-5-phosphate 4-epimerase/fuculose-1-phosphate aldolase
MVTTEQATLEQAGTADEPGRPLGDWFLANLRARMIASGHRLVDPTANGAADSGVVLYPVDTTAMRGFRRHSRAIFVIGIGEADEAPPEPLRAGYPLLLRALANLFVLVVRRAPHGGPAAYFFTLEQGVYSVPHEGDDDAFFARVLDRITPLATSTLVIDNEFRSDLPEELWEGDEHVAAICRAGRRLDQLDLLPAPFPLEEFLSPRDFRHVRQLFGLGGLSYGNLSQRRDAATFWMSASGVDKSRLQTVGQDVLLVTGFDPGKPGMILSVPPDRQVRRVSVDAIEHWMIYQEHPSVGAILHVHAWMDGVHSTDVNYPCGTHELAIAVADLVRQEPDPGRAVVGLRNHGLTITGRSLDEIFERVEDKILRQVPMS